ncbi:MAG: hypothetical protein DMH00_13390 [Acidobacteria bacterium]|nr:MAG: hypothetical protein DMH00_13390 [Acidobacteriota bacterium]
MRCPGATGTEKLLMERISLKVFRRGGWKPLSILLLLMMAGMGRGMRPRPSSSSAHVWTIRELIEAGAA